MTIHNKGPVAQRLEQYTHKVRNDHRSIAFNVVQRAFLKTVLLKCLLFGVKDSFKVVVWVGTEGVDLYYFVNTFIISL